MRRASTFILPILIATGAAGLGFAGGDATFILGGRALFERADWRPFDNQTAFGVTVDVGGPGWPVQIEAGLHGSGRETESFFRTVRVTFSEIAFGVGKYWGAGRTLRPYVGAGLERLKARWECCGGFAQEDDSTGLYLHGGAFWRLGRRFNLGGDARIVWAESNDVAGRLNGFVASAPASYWQIALSLGWGWPVAR